MHWELQNHNAVLMKNLNEVWNAENPWINMELSENDYIQSENRNLPGIGESVIKLEYYFIRNY